jgi:hypothetical protein
MENPKGYGGFRTALESENHITKSVLLATQQKVPEDCNLLIVAAPQKAYLEPEIKLVKDYLASGGRAVFLLAARRGPELGPLLADYGIQVGNDVVVDQVLRLFQGPALGVDRSPISTGGPITEVHTADGLSVHPIRRRRCRQKAGIGSPRSSRPAFRAGPSPISALFNRARHPDSKTDRGPISIAVVATVTAKGRQGRRVSPRRVRQRRVRQQQVLSNLQSVT